MMLAALVGCDEKPSRVQRYCMADDSRQQEQADFVLQCAQNANPKSDEEPEDMLAMCHKIAKETFCVQTWAVDKGYGIWVACSHGSPNDQSACRKAGWGRN